MDCRAHFERMGIRRVGYFGTADGAAADFRRQARGLDSAIVRVVEAKQGVDSILTVMRACAPWSQSAS